MESKRPTTHDIARATGLSQSTVSYALRNEGHLSAKTRKGVLATAKRMGYRPNLFAANLRSLRNRARASGVPVALLSWQSPMDGLYPVSPTVDGLRFSARETGFDLREYQFREVETLPKLLRSLYHQGVQGIFISGLANIGILRPELWAPFSVIACARWTGGLPFHNVRPDVFTTVVLLWRQMVKLGYRRIGVLLCRHSERISDDIEREAALQVMQGDLPAGVTALPPYMGDHNDDRQKILAWFDRVQPDAVIGFNDFHHYLLQDRLCSHGRWVRGFASLHGTTLKGEMAAMSNADAQVGAAAMRLMDSLVRHNDRGIPERAQTLLVEARFEPGRSLPPVKLGSRSQAQERGERSAAKSRARMTGPVPLLRKKAG